MRRTKRSGFVPIVLFSTASSLQEAKQISKGLVEEKLAACVNIAGPVTSFFRWKGKCETAREILLVIKTSKSKYSSLQSYIQKNHSYDVPEIIGWEIKKGSRTYLDWMRESLS